MDVYQIVYASASRRLLNPIELRDLLEEARRNNARVGVSGILLYHEGSFLQVLEGEEQVVRPLFERICRDPRHDRVLELYAAPMRARSFASWSMGFVTLDRDMLRSLPGRHALSSNGTLEEHASAARQLLDAFREGQFRRYILG